MTSPIDRVGTALALSRSRRMRRTRLARRRARSVPALRCTRSASATCRFVAGSRAGRARRRAGLRRGSRVSRWTGRRRRHRGWRRWDWLAQRPAAVDHFLGAALHLGVVALHRGEIQFRGAGAAGQRRGRAPPRPISMAGPPSTMIASPARRVLFHMCTAHVAQPAGDHDRLVVAAHALRGIARRCQTSGSSRPGRPAEFVVERRRADGPSSMISNAEAMRAGRAELLPTAVEAGMRRSRPRTPSSRPWASRRDRSRPRRGSLRRPGAAPGKRRDRGRMIVRLDLDDDIDWLGMPPDIPRLPARGRSARRAALDHCGVVPVGGQHPAGCAHACCGSLRTGTCPAPAVDHPAGVEDLVTAVLGVGLREHHQLHIVGSRPSAPKLPAGSRSRPPTAPAQARIGLKQCRAATGK